MLDVWDATIMVGAGARSVGALPTGMTAGT